ncbi:MAG: exodeoxyribonuclease V subunit gamma [Endozoicomonadaceae bacterium]|nr:exodeoxyribonuclease V subunit gamma [Endozoicomonadaceae bacterium]
MLIRYQSNALTELKNQLLLAMSCRKPSHPFQKETILVQNPGMAHWLKQHIALDQGIASGLHFPMPSSFAWTLYQTFLSNVPDQSVFSKDNMTWLIMQILSELLLDPHLDPDYEVLKHYLDHLAVDELYSDLHLFQLAEKIADVFDQYLVYRPDWILDWEKGRSPKDRIEIHPWQSKLWKKLVEKVQSREQSVWHRSNLTYSLCNTFNQWAVKNKAIHSQLPPVLYVFGISTLPPILLSLFHALSQHIDVIFFTYNPCQAYWFDLKNEKIKPDKTESILHFSEAFDVSEGNALLASMGRSGRDFFSQFNQLNPIDYDCFIDSPMEHDNPSTLLSSVQSHILHLTENVMHDDASFEIDERADCDPMDESIQIMSCHNALREVEILHDYLLKLFDQHAHLTPKDIIVMTPNVQEYRALIEGVFSSCSKEHRIPFSISDCNIRQENPLLEVCMQLLTCNNKRCTVQEIMNWLSIPAISRRYQLTLSQIDILKTWVVDSGIRWGLNTAHQKRLAFPDSENNTWLFGLERMLLGYAIDQSDELYQNTLPFTAVSGLNADAFGLLIEFVEAINQFSLALEKSKTIEDWIALIHQMLADFFMPDSKEETTLDCIRDALNQLLLQTQCAALKTPFSQAILIEWLNHYLDQNISHQYFLNGKLTISTFMPMRSIPFKVICLLGMNDSAYPRISLQSSFDMMALHPRAGDRSRREEDRYLFLEALLAAKDYFYISYQGRSRRDNSIREPSILVSELIAYCHRNFKNKTTNQAALLVKEHPLQPFDPRYFELNSAYFSYEKYWNRHEINATQIVSSDSFQEKTAPLVSGSVIMLEDFIRFYKNPAQYFFQMRLGFSFSSFQKTLDYNEPFMLDFLWQYLCQQKILDEWLIQTDLMSFKKKVIRRIKAMGILPHQHFGRFDLVKLWETITPLLEALLPYQAMQSRTSKIQLSFSGYALKGSIAGCYHHRLLRYRPTKNKSKLILEGILEHLILCAEKQLKQSTHLYYLKSTTGIEKYTIPVLSAETSYQLLETLIHFYVKGLTQPLPFLPNTAFACVQEAVQTAHCSSHLQQIFQKETQYDAYAALLWPHFNSVDWKLFQQCSHDILSPILEHIDSFIQTD